ncbi:MAG: response regulator transcription factor [Flavisolibacter sp.]|jgi:DNA-binding response OmpR family regulator|nr:response regulator transcription factor [Flavisolibacter sp.]
MKFKNEVRTILIIDDDPDDYDIIVEAFREIDPDIRVHHVCTCDEARQYVNHHFDLVLLDINMPGHDGFHWLKSIREKGYSTLPIIMYTNSLSPAHITKAYNEGANLYFSKPDSFQKLQSGLKELIRLDWSHPFSITEQYIKKGNYKVFEVA